MSCSDDFRDTLAEALSSGRPWLIDLEVDPGVKPPSVGTWRLPPLKHPEPVFGAPWSPPGDDGRQ